MATGFDVQERQQAGMFVREYNPGAVRGTVVFIHGLGEHGDCFHDLVTHTALADWRHLVPDLPGHGKSPTSGHLSSLNGIAEHLASWLHESAHRHVTLVGHSMGGVIALLLAEQHPDLVAGLVNVEGNVSIWDCGFSGEAAAYTRTEFRLRGFDELRRKLASLKDPSMPGYLERMKLCDPDTYHWCSNDLVAISERGMLAQRLAGIRKPMLYIAGSSGLNPASRQKLEGVGVVCEEMEGHHWPFLENKEKFVARLVEFLGSCG